MRCPDNRNPYILRLPNEILDSILRFVKYGSQNVGRLSWYQLEIVRRFHELEKTNKTLLALSLSCRRLHDVVMPVLYEDIFRVTDLHENSRLIHRGPNLRALHRTLEHNPSLRPLCKQLEISGDACSTAYEFERRPLEVRSTEIYELIQWMSNVQELTLGKSPLHKGTWPPLIKFVNSMRGITRLHLCDDTSHYVSIRRIVYDLNLPQLQELYIKNVGSCDDFEHDSSLLNEEIERSSPVRVIRLYGIRCHPNAIQELLSWPKALEELSIWRVTHFLGWYVVRSADDDDLLVLQDVLNLLNFQRNSLRKIQFMFDEPDYPVPFPDFCNFSEVQAIKLHWGSIPGSPEEAATKLCGPKVSSISFDFATDGEDPRPHVNMDRDGRETEYYDFNKEAQNYLQTLAEHAHKGGTKLSKIEIHWFPLTLEQIIVGTYPNDWDIENVAGKLALNFFGSYRRMEELKETMKSLGIDFVYPKPVKPGHQLFDEVVVLSEDDLLTKCAAIFKWRGELQLPKYRQHCF